MNDENADGELVDEFGEPYHFIFNPYPFNGEGLNGMVCPKAPHRFPEGPNEDIDQCRICGSPTFAKRPVGEEFLGHIDDCSLNRDHESFCKGGGEGHPLADKIRG